MEENKRGGVCERFPELLISTRGTARRVLHILLKNNLYAEGL